MATNAQAQLFEDYLETMYQQAGAITPGQKLEVLRRVRQEAQEQGYIPVSGGQEVRLDPSDPAFQAALRGETVSVGGKSAVTRKSWAESLSNGQKMALLTGVVMVPMLFMVILLGVTRSGARREAAATAAALAATASAGQLPEEAAPAAGDLVIAPASTPAGNTGAPVTSGGGEYFIVENSTAPSREVAAPASLEIGNTAYLLGEGRIQEGRWEVSGPQWLSGTSLRRVVAIPASDKIITAFQVARIGDVVRVRLNNGNVVPYYIESVYRVRVHQTEIFAGKDPSLVVIIASERSQERWVMLARAGDVETASSVSASSPVSGGSAFSPTAVAPASWVVQVEDSGVYDPITGISLKVESCQRFQQIGELSARNRQEFAVCRVTITGNADYASYSGLSLAVTEKDWFIAAADWWPQVVPAAGAIGDGTLQSGNSVSGNVAGVVIEGRSSHPILLWEAGGRMYVINVLPFP